jgi:hypothetical protein
MLNVVWDPTQEQNESLEFPHIITLYLLLALYEGLVVD